MKKIKFKPLLMAVAMIINTLPFSPVKTAAADNNADVQWNFYDENGKVIDSPTVITGSNIELREEKKPNGYSYKALNVLLDGTPQDFSQKDNAEKIYYEQGDGNGRGRLYVGEDLFVENNGLTSDKIDKTLTYAINGQYYSIQSKGGLTETFIKKENATDEEMKKYPSFYSESTISRFDETSLAILVHGTCTLICTESGTDGSMPQFIIDQNGLDGFFKGYGAASVMPTKSENGVYSYRIAGATNQNDYPDLKFTYNSKANGNMYETQKIGEDGQPVVDSEGKPVMEKTSHIQKGSTIKLVFSIPASNSLLLTVMSPQAALKSIAEEISTVDNGLREMYIQLDKNDLLEAVTKDFKLVNRFNKYNASFRIEWEWLQSEKTDKGFVFNPDAVTINQQGEVTVKRSKENVTGDLVAKIYYEKVSGSGKEGDRIPYYSTDKTKEQEIRKQITIYGTGEPVGVTQISHSELIKNDETNSEYPKVDYPYMPKEYNGDNIKLDPTSPKLLDIDAYSVPIAKYNSGSKGAYEYVFKLNMGKGNGKAEYAVVNVEGEDANLLNFKIKESNGNAQEVYSPGGQIKNLMGSETKEGIYELYVRANNTNSSGQKVKMTISFYVKDHNNVLTEQKGCTITFNVNDSTPSTDARLKSLTITAYETTEQRSLWERIVSGGKSKEILFGFNMDKIDYKDNVITLPYKYDRVTFEAEPNHPIGSSEPIKISRYNATYNNQQVNFKTGAELSNQATDGDVGSVIRNKESEESLFNTDSDLGEVFRYDILVKAQHPDGEETYSVYIQRAYPNDDSTLKSIGIYDENDTELKNNYITSFNPETLEYEIQVPYSTKKLKVNALTNYEDAKITYSPDLKSDDIFERTPKEWFILNDESKRNDATKGDYYQLEITVNSEQSIWGTDTSAVKAVSKYIIKVYLAPPNTDATLKSFSVFNKKNEQLKYTPNFDASPEAYNFDYQLSIPYSEKGIRFSFTPNDKNVNRIEVFSISNDNLVATTVKDEAKDNILLLELEKKSELIAVLPMNHDDIAKEGSHKFIIKVTAEDGKTTKEYSLYVSRDEPSSDAYLKSLIVQDQDYVPIPTFAFNSNRTEYVLEVPYEVTAVNFIPTARHAGAIIDIVVVDENPVEKLLAGSSGKALGSGMTSKNYQLGEPGVEKKFNIKVTAEDAIENPDTGTIVTYEIIVVRAIPSNDSRLKKLDVSNLTEDGLSPIFKASATNYTAALKEGAQGTVITPTANHESAVITVDGIVVESGKASELIAIIEVKQKVVVEVTAQDGVSKTSYVINFTNENLIEKTSNADLRNLTINSGLMTPNFQAAVTEYEVVVEEDVYSVDIIPKTDDPLAQMRVLIGSKEIGDYNGNYAQAISDGKNQIKIEVTSPDESVKKVYTVDVYKDDEKHMKTLLPLDAEDIDFENSDDIITISINQYPRIKSNVFESLKEYPEKTIILQGNDYSLEFKSKDLDTLIPQLEIYDFRMSFDPPHEDDIYDLISSKNANKDIINKVVMAYFDYHGDLPGTATLHLSLGNKYKNQTLYWHYYNEERYRIDYYGEVESNARGSISVQLDHFSTYVVSPKHKIIGSEDRSEITEVAPTDKVHPFTGSKEEI